MRDLPDILCIGALHWDVLGIASGCLPRGGDVPGRVLRQPGGVARNVAAGLAAQGLRAGLLAAVGGDAAGQALLATCRAAGVDCDRVAVVAGQPTDAYLALEDAEGLVAAIAASALLEAAGEAILAPLPVPPGAVVLDSGLAAATLAGLAQDGRLAAARLWLVPAAPAKAARLRPFLTHPGVELICNRAEAAALLQVEPADTAEAAQALCRAGAAAALVTDGAGPVCLVAGGQVLSGTPPPTPPAARVTGAGDALAAGYIAARLRALSPAEALQAGLAAAAAHMSPTRGALP